MLRLGERARRVGKQLLDHLGSGLFQLLKRHDLVHQANASSLFGTEALASQCVAAHLTHADRVAELRDDDDRAIAYVVDIKDASTKTERGLEVLKTLSREQSSGTAFVLTHEAAVGKEGHHERIINQSVASDAGTDRIGWMPFCVIAKERLGRDQSTLSQAAEGLEIGIKRAGLRKGVHDIMRLAREQVMNSFDEANGLFLNVLPEEFERYVMQRSFTEGGSELHVVERAISAYIGAGLRTAFGGGKVQEDMARLRLLQPIALPQTADATSESLEPFRRHEVWEGDELINVALSPIAAGDVFELDRMEKETKDSSKRFVLLGAACDIQLRSNQDRRKSTAYLVPLLAKSPEKAKPKVEADLASGNGKSGDDATSASTVEGSKAKTGKAAASDETDELSFKVRLPFRLEGKNLHCELYQVAEVNLSVLDLASFRLDGRVRFDLGQSKPLNMLPSQEARYDERTLAARQALEAGPFDKKGAVKESITLTDLRLQLAFRSDRDFKQIHCGSVQEAGQASGSAESLKLPRRVTWRLRRCGRIRTPFPAYLLSGFLHVQGRYGFDHDLTMD